MAESVFVFSTIASDGATRRRRDGDGVGVAVAAFVFSIMLASDDATTTEDADADGQMRTVAIDAFAFDLRCELEKKATVAMHSW